MTADYLFKAERMLPNAQTIAKTVSDFPKEATTILARISKSKGYRLLYPELPETERIRKFKNYYKECNLDEISTLIDAYGKKPDNYKLELKALRELRRDIEGTDGAMKRILASGKIGVDNNTLTEAIKAKNMPLKNPRDVNYVRVGEIYKF